MFNYKMPKYIKDVFSDYTTQNNLMEAEIENVNLYKKTNKKYSYFVREIRFIFSFK